MHTVRVLIVDDEPLIRLGIRQAVASIPGVVVAGECSSGLEAIDAIETGAPDLILLDVQMPGCSGMDVVRRIGPQRMPPVVFVTAFDEYAVQAFAVNAVDYLLKPFDAERVQQAIERACARMNAQRDAALAERLRALLDAESLGTAATAVAEPTDDRPVSPARRLREQRPDPAVERPLERLVVRSGERFEFVPLDAIDWVESADNYVQLHCGPKQHLLGETLTNLERRLDPRSFLRIHRSRMVNTSRIVAVHALMGGTYELELRDGTRLTTGRRYRDAVQQLIRA